MLEQGKIIVLKIIVIYFSFSYIYAKTLTNENVTFRDNLHLIVGYIYKNFEFEQKKDSKEFLTNQHTWEQVTQNDCKLIYSDVGSHSSFSLYYNNCIEQMNKKRFTFLQDNYICRISQISGEECLEKQKFNKIMKAYQTFFLMKNREITIQTLSKYNNIAYYLQKAGANEEAIYLLEKIIEKFPNRTVAYYNLGDAYWALGKKQKAIKAYTTYIEQMCHKGLQKKIPDVILERIKK